MKTTSIARLSPTDGGTRGPPRRVFLRSTLAGGAVVFGPGLLTACGGGGDDGSREGQQTLTGETPECAPQEYTLYAGQTNPAGTLTVWNDEDTLFVRFALDPAYSCKAFGTLHLWAGDDLDNVPANPQGTPVPGQFPWHSTGDPQKTQYFDSATSTFAIPLEELSLSKPDEVCGRKLYVVAHAEVCNETAFGGNVPVNVNEPGRWWYYATYNWCCGMPGEDPEEECETAFAYGTHILASDRKANPDNLQVLNLTRNRWGWAIRLSTYSSAATYWNIYAGAGLNDTSKGHLVGQLKVVRTGANVTVTYKITEEGCYLSEIHLYASAAAPTSIAPGQYGNTVYLDHDDKVTVKSVTVENIGYSTLWIIAHSVVCCPVKPHTS